MVLNPECVKRGDFGKGDGKRGVLGDNGLWQKGLRGREERGI